MVADNESGQSIKSEVRTSFGMFLHKAQVPMFKKNYDHLPKDTYFGMYKESTRGIYEAIELRDRGSDYFGKSVSKAVANVNIIIGPALIEKVCLQLVFAFNFMSVMFHELMILF
ncbi:hypothetical protein CRYUN_Cryun29cG0037600 [Craigia yunnanensis]